MTVSLVGRMAMGVSRSDCPLFVTQATSAANPSTWSFSFSRADLGTKMGKYVFRTPSFLISASNQW